MESQIKYEFSMFINTYYKPIIDILSHPLSLENNFFKILYRYQTSGFFHENIENSKFNIKENGYFPAQFKVMSISYEELFTRELTLLKYDIDYDESTIIYSVKQKYANLNLKQYEITFLIKRINTRILLFMKLTSHVTTEMNSPFNKKTKTDLHLSLLESSSEMKYKENYKPLLNFIIKSNKKKLFENIIKFSASEGIIEVKIEGKEPGEQIKKIGEIIHVNWIEYKTRLSFQVLNLVPYMNEEKDCVFYIELIDSSPTQTPFKYSSIVKSISPNTSIISIQHTFETRLSPDRMDRHISTITDLFLALKRLCESG